MNDFYLDSLSLQEEIPRLASVARMSAPAVRSFLEKNPPPSANNQVFLDVGCGTGILTGQISGLFPGYSLIGLDLSQDLINYAQIGHPQIRWIKEDIRETSLGTGSVNYALSHHTLLHIPNPEKAITEIHRILVPEGQFLMIEPDLRNSDVDTLFRELFTKHSEITGTHLHVSGDTKPVLDSLKFKTLQEEEILIQSSGKDNDTPFHQYPIISIGRMAIWSIFSYMGQLLQLRDIYNECVEKYMRKEISIRNIRINISLTQKSL